MIIQRFQAQICVQFNEENFNKLKKMVKILQNAKVSTERKFKGDMDQLSSKVKELEFDNRDLVAKLKEKEKVYILNDRVDYNDNVFAAVQEANITTFKYNEIKRVVRHNQLNPIVDKPDNQKINIDTTKSADLSKLHEMSKGVEVTKTRSDNLKNNASNQKTDNTKPTQEQRTEETQKEAVKKKVTQSERPSNHLEVNKKLTRNDRQSKMFYQKDSPADKKPQKEDAIKQPTVEEDQKPKEDQKPTEEQAKKDKVPKSEPRMEVKGRYDSTLEEFNDDNISQDKRLNHLTVWYDDNHIYGLKANYSLDGGSDASGTEHLQVADKNQLKSGSIEIDADDHITNVSGKYKHTVGYLKIVTASGKTQEFGNVNGTETEHEFVFDIKVKERPISVFGALDKIGKLKLFLPAFDCYIKQKTERQTQRLLIQD